MCYACIDLLAGVSGLLALVSMTRTCSLVQGVRIRWSLPSRDPAATRSMTSSPSADLTQKPEPEPWEWGDSAKYNIGLRLHCLRQGREALADIVFLPFFMAAMLSGYRASPVLMQLCSKGEAAHNKSRIVGVRLETLRQFAFLLVDISILPVFALLILTCYRMPFVCRHAGSNFNHYSLRIHASMLRNATIVLHDLLILLPLILMVSVSWRLPDVIAVCRGTGTPQPSTLQDPEQEDQRHDALDLEFGADDAEIAVGMESDEEIAAAAARLELAQRDASWAQLAGLPHVSQEMMSPALDERTRSFPGPFRKAVWQASLDLALDLPCAFAALMVFLSLWRAPTLWSQFRDAHGQPDRAKQLRLASLKQLLRGLRDLCVLPLFLTLVATLYRLPIVSLKLLARAGAKPLPQIQPPAVQVEKVMAKISAGKGVELQLQVSCAMPKFSLRQGSLRLQVLGSLFWQEVESAFGSSVTSVAQGMLPLKFRTASHTNAYTALSGEADPSESVMISLCLEYKVKRSSIIKKLQKLRNVPMLLQLEAQDKDTGKDTLVAATTVQVQDLRLLAERQESRGSLDELMFDELPFTSETVDVGQHLGVVDSFWVVTFMQFAQMCLDIGHLLLIIPIFFAPWRFGRLLIGLCERNEHLPIRKGRKCLECLRSCNWLMERFLGKFVRTSSAVLKAPAKAFRVQYGPQQLPKALLGDNNLSAYGKLAGQLRQESSCLPQDMESLLLTCLNLADARLYHVAFRVQAGQLLCEDLLTVEEHAVVFEESAAAESALLEKQNQAEALLEVALSEAWAAQKSSKKRSRCKDIATLRKLVRSTARGAFVDVAAFVLAVLLCLTVYRVPAAVADMVREGACSRLRIRIITIFHLQGFVSDMTHAAQVIFLSSFLLVTLVRFPAAMEKALLTMGGLRQTRDILLEESKLVLDNLWSLCSLLTLWKTYEFVIKAVAQAVLVVPACLSYLIGKRLPSSPLIVNLLMGCIIFGGLAAVPFFSFAAFAIGACTVIALAFYEAGRNSEARTIQGWSAPIVRSSWPNLCAVIAVLISVVALPGATAVLAEASSAGPLAGRVWKDALCSNAAPMAMAGGAAVGAWLLLVSLMFVTSQHKDHECLQQSMLLRFLQLLLSHTLNLPVVLSLQLPTACDYDGPLAPAMLGVLLAYIVSILALSPESGLLSPLHAAAGLDLRYPGLYLIGADSMNIAASLACTASSLGGTEAGTLPVSLILLSTVSVMSAMWTLCYAKISGISSCSVASVLPMRCAGSIGLLGMSLLAILLPHWDDDAVEVSWKSVLLAWGTLGFLALLAAALASASERWQRSKELQASGLRQQCRELLAHLDGLLKRREPARGHAGNSVTDLLESREVWRQQWSKHLSRAVHSQQFAFLLLAFEEQLSAEWLSQSFLRRRSDWRQAVLQVGIASSLASSYSEVLKLAADIQQQVRAPPSDGVMRRAVASALGRDDLAKLVVDFIIAHSELRAILQPALFSACTVSSSKGSKCCKKKGSRPNMRVHFERARSAIIEMLARFRRNDTKKHPALRKKGPAKGIGFEIRDLGFAKMVVLACEEQMNSAPTRVWPHMYKMLLESGQVFDAQGNSRTSFPAGLVVDLVTGTKKSKETSQTSTSQTTLGNSQGSQEPRVPFIFAAACNDTTYEPATSPSRQQQSPPGSRPAAEVIGKTSL
eukprot:TRINITY_DN27296_c0_g1_i1.p1 TRINITY_DN27296_c0_g1~~TRINITY_DN27296_c0_g1_i1.p1  ORF type:complete len:1967 (+),score=290.26 TRINITY_DN27296_c0_g1_i1:867-5903(+)